MDITKEFLLKNGFKQVIVKNPNNDSDPQTLELFQKGEKAVKFNGVCCDVLHMEFDIPAISGTISTVEELQAGMNHTK